jgi:hypothetical protein
MLFRAQGAQAAVVGSDNKVHLVKLGIGRDYGASIEVLTGISANDQIVLNPPDSLEDNEEVHVSQQTSTPGESGQGQPNAQQGQSQRLQGDKQ